MASRTNGRGVRALNCEEVAGAFVSAARVCGADTPFYQADVKNVVAVTLDRLVACQRGTRNKGIMWAAHVKEIERHLTATRPPQVPKPTGCMVDIAIFEASDSDPFTTMATAESEAYAGHWPEDGRTFTSETVDYLWDLSRVRRSRRCDGAWPRGVAPGPVKPGG